MLGQPQAPGAVGQNHGLGHDQVQWRTALASADADRFAAPRFLAAGIVKFEVVVRAVEVFGLAAHHFTLRFQVPGQLVQKAQFCGPSDVSRGRRGQRACKKCFGEGAVKHVVSQVAFNWHQLQAGHALADLQGGLVKRDVKRHGRAVAPSLQSVVLHHFVRQHGELVARHIDG